MMLRVLKLKLNLGFKHDFSAPLACWHFTSYDAPALHLNAVAATSQLHGTVSNCFLGGAFDQWIWDIPQDAMPLL